MSSIQRKPSGRWETRYRDPDGRQRGRTVPTKIEARRFLERVGADMQRAEWVDPRLGQLAFRAYAELWLAHRPDLRPRTVELYRYLLDRYILPAFGRTDLSKITPLGVRTWHAELAGQHPSTAAKAYRLLRAILNTAVADERITRNPCRVEGAGVEQPTERPIASIREVDALTAAMPERLAMLVVLAAWSGLRRSELLALRRSDVDLPHGPLRIQRTSHQLRDGTVITGPRSRKPG